LFLTDIMKEGAKLAIFGTAKAAEITYNMCKDFADIICFIDDFKDGKIKDIEVVNREDFKVK